MVTAAMKKSKMPSGKKKSSDRVEELVEGQLAEIATADDTFKEALALFEKYKEKYTELEQHVENLSSSERSISLPADVKDARRTNRTFKIAITGTAVEYQIKNAEEKNPSNVDQLAWASSFEEALANVITQVVLARRLEAEPKQ
jgi:hypothetical protein